jgi:hypothetical protein
VTDAQFAWRVSAATRQLQALIERRERGEWMWRTTDALRKVERHIKQMTDKAHLAAIRAALPEEERTACDGSR